MLAYSLKITACYAITYQTIEHHYHYIYLVYMQSLPHDIEGMDFRENK
jgi:hypothetical protein